MKQYFSRKRPPTTSQRNLIIVAQYRLERIDGTLPPTADAGANLSFEGLTRLQFKEVTDVDRENVVHSGHQKDRR